MSQQPFVIGITGASGSGKSTLSRALARSWGPGLAPLPMDSYYRDLRHLSPRAREWRNFDRPTALDLARLADHLGRIRAGLSIEVPSYDFSTHTSSEVTTPLNPPQILVVEGLFCLQDARIRANLDLSIYMDVPTQVCRQRRVYRDVSERGRSVGEVLHRYAQHVEPALWRWVLPSRCLADLVLSGSRPIDDLVAEVLESVLIRRGSRPATDSARTNSVSTERHSRWIGVAA